MLLDDFLSKSAGGMAVLEKSSAMSSICLKQHFPVIMWTLQGSTNKLQMSFSLWIHVLQQVQSAWPAEMRVAAKSGVVFSCKICRTGRTAYRFPYTLSCEFFGFLGKIAWKDRPSFLVSPPVLPIISYFVSQSSGEHSVDCPHLPSALLADLLTTLWNLVDSLWAQIWL